LSALLPSCFHFPRQSFRTKRRYDVWNNCSLSLIALWKVSGHVVERTKRLETRANSVEEMLKILRELWEANLRRPDNPTQDNG
jgi:hypothetical protein